MDEERDITVKVLDRGGRKMMDVKSHDDYWDQMIELFDNYGERHTDEKSAPRYNSLIHAIKAIFNKSKNMQVILRYSDNPNLKGHTGQVIAHSTDFNALLSLDLPEPDYDQIFVIQDTANQKEYLISLTQIVHAVLDGAITQTSYTPPPNFVEEGPDLKDYGT